MADYVYIVSMSETRQPTKGQTFALFCCTGKDWRGKVTFDQASQMIGACKGSKDKNANLEICNQILAGEILPNPPAVIYVKPDFQKIYDAAHNAGMQAATACTPRPMIVGTPTTLFGNDIDYSKPTEFVSDGVCGFANVKIRPATCAFVKWLKSKKIGRSDSYAGGYDIWIHDFNQSMQKKEAYAAAFASVLSEHGIKAYMESRMD